MTPGQEALAEVARLEAARVYSCTVRENREVPAVHAPKPALVDVNVIRRAFLEGAAVSEVMNRFGVSYDVARAVKHTIRGAA